MSPKNELKIRSRIFNYKVIMRTRLKEDNSEQEKRDDYSSKEDEDIEISTPPRNISQGDKSWVGAEYLILRRR